MASRWTPGALSHDFGGRPGLWAIDPPWTSRATGEAACHWPAAWRPIAVAIVSARAERHEPPITGAAELEVEVDPRTARAILDELRAAELAPPAVVAGASGRRMAAPARPGKVVRLRQATIERLAEVTGRPVGEDVVGQIVAVLDRVKA